jgi:uncharacterized damage-inducible protein DinB
MERSSYVNGLKNMKAFFDRSTSALEEKDSGYAPKPEMLTVAQQVAHTAHTIDWFIDGAFTPKGFDLDFAGNEAKIRRVTSLKDARAWMDRAVEVAIRVIEAKSPEDLAKPLPEGIMGGMPSGSIVDGMIEHTAHHRGALATYTRLLGKVPPMPYR